MPIYEYQCTACGHVLEVMQKFSEEPLKECPHCQQPDLKKLVSSSSFHLKGGGWYVTDIRDKDKPKPETTQSASDVKSEKPEAKDKKPAGETSSKPTDETTG